MKSQVIRYDDWGNFIHISKKNWKIVRRWLTRHGVKIEDIERTSLREHHAQLRRAPRRRRST